MFFFFFFGGGGKQVDFKYTRTLNCFCCAKSGFQYAKILSRILSCFLGQEAGMTW